MSLLAAAAGPGPTRGVFHSGLSPPATIGHSPIQPPSPRGHLTSEALPTIGGEKQLRLAGHSLNSLMQLFQEVNNRTLCPSGWEGRAEVWPGGHSLFWPFRPSPGCGTVASGAKHKKVQNKTLTTLPAPLSAAATDPLGGKGQATRGGLSSYEHKLSVCVSTGCGGLRDHIH